MEYSVKDRGRGDSSDLVSGIFGEPQRPIRPRRDVGGVAASGGDRVLGEVPPVVIRPILLPEYSANHSAPSGPAAMSIGLLPAVGTAYSAITPAVVIRRSYRLRSRQTTARRLALR